VAFLISLAIGLKASGLMLGNIDMGWPLELFVGVGLLAVVKLLGEPFLV
jgi:hypothetical protein